MSLIPFDDRDGAIWLDGELIPWRDAKLVASAEPQVQRRVGRAQGTGRGLTHVFLKSLQGKTLVGQFELLQTKHVYGVGGQPVQNLRETDVQGVHVPGGEFHGVRQSQ